MDRWVYPSYSTKKKIYYDWDCVFVADNTQCILMYKPLVKWNSNTCLVYKSFKNPVLEFDCWIIVEAQFTIAAQGALVTQHADF